MTFRSFLGKRTKNGDHFDLLLINAESVQNQPKMSLINQLSKQFPTA